MATTTTKWTLIFWLTSSSRGVQIHHVKFNTQRACEEARQKVMDQSGPFEVVAFCIEDSG